MKCARLWGVAFVSLMLCANARIEGGASLRAAVPAGPVNDGWKGFDDLDGNGTADSIRVRLEERMGGFWNVAVVVNRTEARFVTEVAPSSFSIADVDSTDRYREIAVWDEGPSDDYETHFLWFDGTRVRLMGVVPGSDILTDGSGVVEGEARGKILHTWYFPVAYRLTRSHELQVVKTQFIPMGTIVRLLVDLPLNLDPDPAARTTLAAAGSCGVITRTDDREWCELKTLDGNRGWFRVTGFKVLGRDPREVFDGLFFAD